MRLNALVLLGAITVAAIPLSAGAEPAQEDHQGVASHQEAAPAEDACGPGWSWEQAGYAKHGKWRPAHCAPEEMAY